LTSALVGGELHGPAALHPEKSPRYALDRRLGEPQSRCGEEKILDHIYVNIIIFVVVIADVTITPCKNHSGFMKSKIERERVGGERKD
jgi:hypothetical protein